MKTFNEIELLIADELLQAREWIADCQWPDLEESEVAGLSDGVIQKAISRHFDGGIQSFKLSCVPVQLSQKLSVSFVPSIPLAVSVLAIS